MAAKNDILEEDRVRLEGAEEGDARRRRFRLGPGARRAALPFLFVLVAAFLAYYLIGMAVVHRIDDDPTFQPANPIEGGSRAVDMAAALIEREVDVNGWTSNDPFFLPGAALDNMPNFQQGLFYTLGRFAVEMGDQVGRARGSSQVDPDLDRAAGLLRYPADRWIFDFSASLAPVASSDSQYRAARRALIDYNGRVAAGTAVFDRRADNLLRTLERFASDLGSSSAIIADHLNREGGFLIDTRGDDIFYATKGRLYGYYMLLKALGEDFEDVIRSANLTAVWAEMLESFAEAAALQPLVVVTGAPDGQFAPNHLAAQGFFLLRARTQLREIANVLIN
jgi:hypothetical protein